jgi:hypothetical protein
MGTILRTMPSTCSPTATYQCLAGAPEAEGTCRPLAEGPFPAAECTNQCRLAGSPDPSPAVVMVPTAVDECRTEGGLSLERTETTCALDTAFLCQVGSCMAGAW